MSDRWVFWDFDGTLGFGPHGPGAWSPCLIEALDRHHPGHGITRDDIRPALRNGYPWHTPDLPHPELGTPEAWWASLETRFAAIFTGAGFAQTAAALARETRHRYADGTRWGLYRDSIPALTSLRDRGWRNAILSNNIPELEANLTTLGLTSVVELVVCSAVIGYEKPHPAAYRHAVDAAGVAASRCWMVGDSYPADVRGAEDAGLRSVLIRRVHPDAPRHAPDAAAAARLILDTD